MKSIKINCLLLSLILTKSILSQDSIYVFPSANKVCVEIFSNVELIESSYNYYYSVSSLECSEQKIWDFRVETKSRDNNIINPAKWISFISEVKFKTISWGVSDSNYFIKRNEKLSGFKVKSVGLPSICGYFVTGFVPLPVFPQGEEPEVVINNDIFENCKKGFTIGPKDPPTVFVSEKFLDTIVSYTSKSYELHWIINQPTADKYINLLINAKSYIQQNNISAARNTLQTVLTEVDKDSSSNLTSEAYALLRYNTEYLLEKLPEAEPELNIRLINSTGTLLTNGSLQYYEGAWKAAVNNGDGTFKVITQQPTVSLRMTYEYGNQTVSNIPAQNNTYTFQTVSIQVQLVNSQGALMDQGTVQYYAGAWREFGTTTNGVASKELLPNTYSFRMTYAFGSNDKQQDIGIDPVVVFQTVNSAVQLQNSQGAFIDQGTVQYYAGAWRDFGTTINGTVNKELLPNNYSFRMNYAYFSNDKQQNIGTNPTVDFQTVNATVQLQNSQGILIDQGTVQYYAGAWRAFGTTSNGTVAKELLPNNYSFRMTYEYISNDKQQNIGTDPTVIFPTTLTTIRVLNAQSQPVDNASVKYYAGAWRTIGNTVNGEVTKELLPANITFRVNAGAVQQDKTQNTSTNPVVEFNLP